MDDERPQAKADSQREEWTVPVRDAVRANACEVTVAVAETRVVVIPPPSGAFELPAEQYQRYFDAHRAAINVAQGRQNGYRAES